MEKEIPPIGFDQIFGARLIIARIALGVEIKSAGAMIASKGANAKTIIPWMYRMEITKVQPRYTQKRKRQAWDDLNEYMVALGFERRTL